LHRRLLIRPGAIGDVIISLPELEAARADYTEVWAPRPTLPLITFADRTRALIDTGIERVGVVEGAAVAELASFDSIYSWYGTHRPEFRHAVRHLPFTFFPALPIAARGIPVIEVPRAPVEDFAVIHPFSGSAKKNWPLENFRQAAARLEMPVKWSAGPEETLDHAVRFDDLYALACWLSTARVYLGNDSGISHLAAAVGTPVVAIFLTTDPEIWAPRGPRVTVLRDPGIDDVVRAARAVR
jgi:ADP-heptose:LPS heptosyltransferase